MSVSRWESDLINDWDTWLLARSSVQRKKEGEIKEIDLR